MKISYLVFGVFLAVLAWGTENILSPSLLLGRYGNDSLEFCHPGLILAGSKHLYVVDEGNNRIQKLTFDGDYAAETNKKIPGLSDAVGFAVDLGDMLYLSVEDQDQIAQYDQDLWPVAVYPAPDGFLACDGSGILYVFDPQQNMLHRFVLATRQTEQIELPAVAAGRRFYGLAVQGSSLWLLGKTQLLESDLFGKIRKQIDLPVPCTGGFVCPVRVGELLVLVDTTVFRLTAKEFTCIGNLPRNIQVGGMVSVKGHFWITDRQTHRILQFSLNE